MLCIIYYINNTIFYINGAHPTIIQKLEKLSCTKVELECSFKANGFRHVDELMCFMPYGEGKYKVWFYDELNTNSFRELNEFNLNRDQERRDFLVKLNSERLRNLDKISNALFGSEYNMNMDKFVFFDFFSYKPSIFNRVWIEKNGECICLFNNISSQNNNVSKLDCEMNRIRSYLTGKCPSIHFINVPHADENIPQGGVHCLIKQQFQKIE
jgi:hypothetical protein